MVEVRGLEPLTSCRRSCSPPGTPSKYQAFRAAAEFSAVVLTGPRQSGKTTLLKHLFGETYGYVSLEPPDVRAAAVADPRGFLELYHFRTK